MHGLYCQGGFLIGHHVRLSVVYKQSTTFSLWIWLNFQNMVLGEIVDHNFWQSLATSMAATVIRFGQVNCTFMIIAVKWRVSTICIANCVTCWNNTFVSFFLSLSEAEFILKPVILRVQLICNPLALFFSLRCTCNGHEHTCIQ